MLFCHTLLMTIKKFQAAGKPLPELRCFKYWGKAKPIGQEAAPYHLLPYHCLDVAAVGMCLMRLRSYRLTALAVAGLAPESLPELMTFFLALHDLGKFARGFQNLVPNMSPLLVPADKRFQYGTDVRHDTLGWMAWKVSVAAALRDSRLPKPEHGAWADWFMAMAGHHGEPPRELIKGQFPVAALKSSYFHDEDLEAAVEFGREMAALLLPEQLPQPSSALKKAIKAESWRLAGIAVLADWIGSNQDYFTYVMAPMPLNEYWETVALPTAERAVAAAGLAETPIKSFSGARQLFDYLATPTPLQAFTAQASIGSIPQLFILEDVTGAGKTEAALILAHRLMANGNGRGIYFGLPTMATANQMYRRVGDVFRRFYADGAQPNLVLAHGARKLVEDFEASILTQPPPDADYGATEPSASGSCAAWLADSTKKALLAEVGVGTIDQTLLAVMPARHQSLRLLGLSGKVLIADEVHAFDAYTGRLLQVLLEAHARQGGSAILLSATLPGELRADLVEAFQRGLGGSADEPPDSIPVDTPYPLVTWASQTVKLFPVATRDSVKRTVAVNFLHAEDSILARIRASVEAGQCVCWIRNTVDDARDAWCLLRQSDWINPEHLMLFHSRFALDDRLRIENEALDVFGKHSLGAARCGRVLVASQVVEQSLDLDFDVLITDLAPVDLIIQRAGRLHRHSRDKAGNPAECEARSAPVLDIHAPEFDLEPAANWHSCVFPRAAYVYPDTGRLWLTQKVLLDQGVIVMPEGARHLIESVYGLDADLAIPAVLLKASDNQAGKMLGDRSLARTNALQLESGYCRDSGAWDAEEKTPTRLSEDDREFVLLIGGDQGLQAWAREHPHPWAASTVKIAARNLERISPAWEKRFAKELESLRERHRALRYVGLLPLVMKEGAWCAEGLDAKGRAVAVRYDPEIGLETKRGKSIGSEA